MSTEREFRLACIKNIINLHKTKGDWNAIFNFEQELDDKMV
jgi:hypothetical protein